MAHTANETERVKAGQEIVQPFVQERLRVCLLQCKPSTRESQTDARTASGERFQLSCRCWRYTSVVRKEKYGRKA